MTKDDSLQYEARPLIHGKSVVITLLIVRPRNPPIFGGWCAIFGQIYLLIRNIIKSKCYNISPFELIAI
jgi:hypothetical protein